MAQSQVACQGLVNPDVTQRLSGRERFEFDQYDKIVEFRNSILAGKHPVIKLPPSSSLASQVSNLDAATRNAQTGVSFGAAQNAQPPAPSAPSRLEFNPIFLEKSDDLIRAELQLQRQRIERALKEEVDQRRALKNSQAEPLSELDLSDVLTKALALVQAASAAPPLPAHDNLTANAEAASDSFDDDTFYSSRHDTPESHLTSRVRNDSEKRQTNAPEQPHAHMISHNAPVDPRTKPSQQGNHGVSLPGPPHIHRDIATSNQATAPRPIQVPGLNNYPDGGVSSTGPSHPASGEQSQSEDSGVMEVDYRDGNAGLRESQRLRDEYAAMHPPSPLVRNHDLIATGASTEHVVDVATGNLVGAPAQVAALRGEPTTATSPESSPQGPNGSSDRKKGKKKKKRKSEKQSERQGPEVDAEPYIKPEPRSPSPVTGAPLIRPNKRQRLNQRPPQDPGQGGQRYESGPAPTMEQDGYAYASHPVEAHSRGYVQPGLPPQRAVSTTVVGGTRYAAGYADERMAPNDTYMQQYGSQRLHSQTYTPGAAPSSRPLPQHVIIDDPYRDPQHRGHEAYEVPRMSVRPDGESLLAAQRPPPARIIVDEFGREYIEPPPPSARHSLAPAPRLAEPEVYYERVRAPSRYPEPGHYEEGGVVYTRPPSAYAMPRRVVTQPQYLPQEFRESRHREFSTAQGMGPRDDYVRVMPPPSRRVYEERPREYISRAASVRPAEPVRYELPQDYGRVQSVRPGPDAREYAAGTQQEPQREFMQPYMREVGSRPVEQHVIRREYSTRPMEQYYDPQVPGGEVAFIERPRGTTQDIVYADDARREVYR
jgi:hypothetical protein